MVHRTDPPNLNRRPPATPPGVGKRLVELGTGRAREARLLPVPVEALRPPIGVSPKLAQRAVAEFAQAAMDDLESGNDSRWVVINLTGLKYVNDKFPGGYRAGDAYLAAARAMILEIARRELGRDDVQIDRQGCNFLIHLTATDQNSKQFISAVKAAFNQGEIPFTYEYEANGEKRKAVVKYSHHTEQRLDVVNVCELTFEAALFQAGVASLEIYHAVTRQIYFLNRVNRPEYEPLESGFDATNYTVGTAELPRLRSYAACYRLLHYDELDGWAGLMRAGPDVPLSNIEPASGLPTFDQLEIDVASDMAAGKDVYLVIYDVNKMGKYRAYGYPGDQAMGLITAELLLVAAARAFTEMILAGEKIDLPKAMAQFKHGIRGMYRRGKLSEEYCHRFTSDTFQSLTQLHRFVGLLFKHYNDDYRMWAEEQLLAGMPAGQGFLLFGDRDFTVEHREIAPGYWADVVPLKINNCPRPEDVNLHQYEGITVTAVISKIGNPRSAHLDEDNGAVNIEKVVRMADAYLGRAGRPDLDIILQKIASMLDLLKQAKDRNKSRENVCVVDNSLTPPPA